MQELILYYINFMGIKFLWILSDFLSMKIYMHALHGVLGIINLQYAYNLKIFDVNIHSNKPLMQKQLQCKKGRGQVK